MPYRKIDFKELNQLLMAKINSIIPVWIPGGKARGREWVSGSIFGGKGESFSINLETGAWSDFAVEGHSGGDLISLWALRRGMSQLDAANELADEFGYNSAETIPDMPTIKPIKGVKPTQTWRYHNKSGSVIATVTRYDHPNGKKTFSQQSLQESGWVYKSHPKPRPLYNLHLLDKQHVLIVEGEKTADRAQAIVQHRYSCTTWLGGSNGIHSADWQPLYEKNILILPDADGPGMQAGRIIADILAPHCPEVKIVDVKDQPLGWDLAYEPDWTWDDLKKFALSRVETVKPKPSCEPEPNTTPETTTSETAQTPVPVTNITNNIENLHVISPDDEVDVSCPEDKFLLWEDIGLPMTKGKTPINNLVSAMRIFAHSASGLYYDEFYNKIFYQRADSQGRPLGCPRELDDTDEVDLTLMVQSHYGLSKMELGTIRNAILSYARRNTRNEPKEWLTGLQWDGVPRMDTFFSSYYGTDDTEYHRAVARYFWCGLCARIVDPGQKLDCMVVLQGRQGRMKSTSLSIIGGKWFSEATSEVGTKDFLQSLQGVLIMEIAELSSFKKAHIEAIKNTLSTRCDRFRLPYARNVQTFPRRCILTGTTNEDHFLGDQTGNRRFYPVQIDQCDIGLLSRDRDQLFAEALIRYREDNEWWNVPSDCAEEAQESARISDMWEDVINFSSISNAGLDIYNGITITEICTKLLHIPIEKMDRMVSIRISSILKQLGFRNRVIKSSDRRSVRVWSVDRFGGYVDRKGNFVDTSRGREVNENGVVIEFEE